VSDESNKAARPSRPWKSVEQALPVSELILPLVQLDEKQLELKCLETRPDGFQLQLGILTAVSEGELVEMGKPEGDCILVVSHAIPLEEKTLAVTFSD